MSLFVNQSFTSHSGLNLHFKIDCDALSDEDVETLAAIIARRFVFGQAYGVPRGGVRLANALTRYQVNYPHPAYRKTLIVDDVLTTGESMEDARELFGRVETVGVVVFARGAYPKWITPLFTLNPELS